MQITLNEGPFSGPKVCRGIIYSLLTNMHSLYLFFGRVCDNKRKEVKLQHTLILLSPC